MKLRTRKKRMKRLAREHARIAKLVHGFGWHGVWSALGRLAVEAEESRS